MTECKITENKRACTCTYSCSKKGMCCACLSFHRGQGEVPACFFPADVEKTYDRSLENFIRVYQAQGAGKRGTSPGGCGELVITGNNCT
jgi:hypothetical protein